MENSTKQEILKTAKKLFNERGYNTVSLRDISSVMGISKGNLTYHFKKKEDIIEAILDDISSHYKPPAVPKSLCEMNALFIHIQEMVKENAFYFWHHTQLSQLSPKIREQQKNVYQTNHRLFLQAFSILNQNGIIHDEKFNSQYKQIVDSLLLACTYWTPFCELRCEQSQSTRLQNHAWGLIYPMLTEKGIELLKTFL